MDVMIISIDSYYKNNINDMIGQLDLMLAELNLGEEQVRLIEQSKLKYTCASLLIDRELYQESILMECDGAMDAADVIEWIGLKESAEMLRGLNYVL